MKNYLNLMQEILDTGIRQSNRTGIDTLTLPGAMLKFDLREGFPAVTTKKLAFKAVVGELICFLRGETNVKAFQELGCNVWNDNAAAPAWLNSLAHSGEEGDLGHIYGAMWRNWPVVDCVGHQSLGLDQVAQALYTVRKNPESRRIIVNAWNPEFLNQAALPPCHVLFQLLPHVETGVLHMMMYQRSCDMFLGVPFNIASYALLLELFARWTGYQAGTLTMALADAHIYVNHIDQVKEQLSRDTLPIPKLYLAPGLGDDSHTLEELLDKLHPSLISLDDYRHHPPIKAPMAV